MNTAIETEKKTDVMFRCPADQIRALFASVSFAMDSGSSSSRYPLSSVQLTISGGMATAVATDGRQLAIRKLDCVSSAQELTVLIPRDVAIRLAGIGKTASGMIDFQFIATPDGYDGSVSWRQRNGAQSLAWAPIIGRYPNWRDIVNDTEAREYAGSISGRAEVIRDSLPDTNDLEGWIYSASDRKWFRDPVYIGKHTELQTTGDCETMLDIDRLRGWLNSLGDGEVAEIVFTGPDTPILGKIGGETRFVLMPMVRDKKGGQR